MRTNMVVNLSRRVCGAAVLLALGINAQAANVLNDTGSNQCIVNNAFTTACAGTGQDGDFGRDVTQKLAKDGRLGFAYRKVCNSGEFAGVGACPANPVFGAAANEWGCTQDRVTGLIWELKTTSGTRAYTATYTATTAGSALAFVNTVNAAGLCGANNWRLPTRAELLSLVDYGVNTSPRIDTAWFPNTKNSYSWSSDGYVGNASNAWVVNFDSGYVGFNYRGSNYAVRLVRVGQ
jgi:hypothetical protein